MADVGDVVTVTAGWDGPRPAGWDGRAGIVAVVEDGVDLLWHPDQPTPVRVPVEWITVVFRGPVQVGDAGAGPAVMLDAAAPRVVEVVACASTGAVVVDPHTGARQVPGTAPCVPLDPRWDPDGPPPACTATGDSA